MQKKSNLESGPPPGGIVIKLSDLNSDESIKNWIAKELGSNYSNSSNDDIKSAIEGIIRDPLFVSSPNSKKQLFISQITQLINKL